MAVNKYFQKGIPEAYSNTQNLTERLIIESIKIRGFDVFYLPRTLVKFDEVLTEDTMSRFENAFSIEMRLENVQGFEGDGGLLSKFGIFISDTCTFTVARRRWKEEVGRKDVTMLPERPCEGDIIYFPMTKSFFEIKKVVHDNPFYQLGKLYVYSLECELYTYSSETFDTGVSEIDDLINPKSLVEGESEVVLETGDPVLGEDGLPIAEDSTYNEDAAGAQNTVFKNKVSDVLEFSETNPFGEVIKR